MDMGNFNLFIKMIQEEYKLTDPELETLSTRMLADDLEFDKVWSSYKKARRFSSGVDSFKFILQELLI